ncbi:ABC transporter substrate-binding protein [Pectobacteriaceae bacterium CE70]|uniref:ABC transporter substrate-binding protein n=1 Tax=Serratia sp. (strain ATCC 39006) TaxID=104623 RepID=A0A2I5TK96_SERS3|nr:ABC transporter substrate-binding protein [Serratia sp. ATCC 39006]WJV64731.1 ABC transporter substrate-binding protein [Pectobacteriaceae bacterium C52]WJV68899.1 ABC transporter substrate-binding protein [Pectobacteriaceae bacterium CE70]WJY12822.1 ABC transporter substrate-binding protein [Pectobacteriaceae bacterium C80]AUH00670.1 ABC transporter substrate-binding protein [Serratia sp. ATCC 39006]AUH04991.1 ABC transporter substrate-binding protein [Serratia sp. ATCC 39006]
MKARHTLLSILGGMLLLGTGAAAQAESIIRIGLGADPDMLDPHLARTYYGRFVFAAMCDRLVDVDKNLKVVPGLATDWSWSADGKTLTMNLRHGVTFQDGEKFDAQSVKFNINRAMTLPGSLRKSELSSVARIEVTGPYQVMFHLKNPDAALLSQLTDRAGAMLAPQAAAKPDFAMHPVCSGPYAFESRVQQDRIVLKRFNNYWNKAAYHFDKVIFLPIPDASVRLANLRAGDLDLTEGIRPSDVKTVASNPALRLEKVTGLGYQGITFNIANGKTNTANPFAKDARVREAFSLAIDREALNQVVFEGLFTPANQAFSPVSPYHVNLPVAARNVEKAKALLAAAGVKPPVNVTLLVTNNPTAQQVGQVIQAMAGEAGFNVTLQMSEFATLLDRQQRGDFQISLSGWSGRPDPDGNIFSFIYSKGGLNDGHYSNPLVDSWLIEARQANDVAKRQALYAKVVTQLQTDMPLAYLYFEPRIFGMTKKLTGFTPSPDGLVRLAGVKMAP